MIQPKENHVECKIADFGLSNNLSYKGMECGALYTNLIPPECVTDHSQFSTKSDVYFFGWLLVEMALQRHLERYNVSETMQFLQTLTKPGMSNTITGDYMNLVKQCLNEVCFFGDFFLEFEDIFISLVTK